MRYIQSPSQQQNLKGSVTAVVKLAIYLQFVISEIRNVDAMTKLGILLRCVIRKKLLVTNSKQHREITVAGHTNDLNGAQHLSKLDILMEKRLMV